MSDMKRVQLSPVAYVEILHGGVVLTFADGKSSFLSASLLHAAACQADELSEFSDASFKASLWLGTESTQVHYYGEWALL
jgi:hypothetical protein